jgi:hypothetical protein
LDLTILRPGDAIVDLPDWYNPIDRIICQKTWTNVCHVRIYTGNNKVVQAILKGVNIYDFDPSGIGAVLEPTFPFDLGASMAWFYSKAQGQKYDVWGLLKYFGTSRPNDNPDAMICSEFGTRFYRSGGGVPFNTEADADLISPAQFCQTSGFRFRWRHPNLQV